jgi:hypothetical protein
MSARIFFRRDGQDQEAKFGQCIVAQLGGNAVHRILVDVETKFVTNIDDEPHLELTIQLAQPFSEPSSQRHRVFLEHAPLCPVSHATNERRQARGVFNHGLLKVASVLLLRDHDGRCLITRRGAHMRTFPSCWVFPGGQIDPGETLAEAATREIYEV